MKFNTHEKTVFSAAILILLCINLLPVLTATARPPPGKGKPDKGAINIDFLSGPNENIVGPVESTVIKASSSMDDEGRLTFARANPPHHCDNFVLELLGEAGFWSGYEGPVSEPPVVIDFSGPRWSNDFQISLEWTTGDKGEITFYYWFDYDGNYEEDDSDNYRLVAVGNYEYDSETGKYSPLEGGSYYAEIQYQKGPGKKNYDTCWSGDITFTFTHTEVLE